jgi:hypothetical protein
MHFQRPDAEIPFVFTLYQVPKLPTDTLMIVRTSKVVERVASALGLVRSSSLALRPSVSRAIRQSE